MDIRQEKWKKDAFARERRRLQERTFFGRQELSKVVGIPGV